MTGRLGIDDVTPVIGEDRYPAKAVVGEQLPIEATVWREGHDKISATVAWRGPKDRLARQIRMAEKGKGLDRFAALIVPDAEGAWTFRVEAWSDPWATWLHAVEAKLEVGQGADELANDLETGALLLERVGRRPERRADKPFLFAAAEWLRDTERPLAERVSMALGERARTIMFDFPVRELITRSRPHKIWVDRKRALFGSWYELFPRSTGGLDETGRPVHGTLATAATALDRVARMGFDVVYLPPIHPIGKVNRKGPNNTLVAGPDDVGSPWAIGSDEGGHDAIHPQLGTPVDFKAFVDRASELHLEVALDLAIQCAPDHPWVAEHPEWFTTKPDGT
ncbi:MAG TPA: maltotransferase domain-containing protein, partial [Pseudonocardiaceae bacterium]